MPKIKTYLTLLSILALSFNSIAQKSSVKLLTPASADLQSVQQAKVIIRSTEKKR